MAGFSSLAGGFADCDLTLFTLGQRLFKRAFAPRHTENARLLHFFIKAPNHIFERFAVIFAGYLKQRNHLPFGRVNLVIVAEMAAGGKAAASVGENVGMDVVNLLPSGTANVEVHFVGASYVLLLGHRLNSLN